MTRPPPLVRARAAVAAFFRLAYRSNLTGQSAMVAYNLLLSIFPLALVALFIAAEIVGSGEAEVSIVRDIEHLFPGTAETTITNVLNHIRAESTRTGIIAVVASLWFCTSFWGALDTAFTRIYGLPGRGWLRQKRFALAMVLVVLMFMAATIAVPTLQGILIAGAQGLPFGLADVTVIVYGLTLAAGVIVVFALLCVIYATVPSGYMPWRAIWPGALGATLAILVIDYAFPLYLSNVSTLARLGTTLVLIVIVLIWFYALAVILLGGATVNALRLRTLSERV